MFKSYLILAVVALGTATALILAAGKKPHPHEFVGVEVEVSPPESTPESTPEPLTVEELKKRDDYRKYLWNTATINGSKVFRIDKTIVMYLENKKRYVAIERMRNGGVPAAIIFTLHGRESTWSFNRHLHEGSPLTGRTKYIPMGRPKAPPRNGRVYTFEESAEDVLYKLKDLESVNWRDCNTALTTIEEYNGLGYFYYRPIHSPYLWAGTNHYTRGKYVKDGKWDKNALDKQLGTCAILKRMSQKNIDIGFK